MRERAREREGGEINKIELGKSKLDIQRFKADTTCCLFEETEKFGGNDIHQLKSQDSLFNIVKRRGINNNNLRSMDF